MNATLHTSDGRTLTVEIRSLRAFPLLIVLPKDPLAVPLPGIDRYFVRTGGPTVEDYQEAVPEPVIPEAE